MKKMLMLGVALMASPSAAAQVMPLDEAATNFGARQTYWAADISPSGNQLAILTAGEGTKTYVQVYDLESGENRVVLQGDGKEHEIDWCRFGSEAALICRMAGESKLSSGLLVDWSRLAAISLDGSYSPTMLGQRASRYDSQIRQFDGQILDWLPKENAVLMAREYVPEQGKIGTRLSRTKSGLGVDRIDLSKVDRGQVESPEDAVSSYMTDGQGNVRIRRIPDIDSNGRLTNIVRFDYRRQGSNKWEDLLTFDSSANGFYPIAVDAKTNSVYGLEPLNGREALYRMSLDGSMTKTLVAKNDRVDIGGVVRLGRGLEIIGYGYSDERDHIVYFDPKYEKLQAALGKALPHAPIVDFRGASADGNILLLSASSDANPGELYVLNQTTKEMSPLMQLRPQFQGQPQSSVKPVTYKSRDGADIPAYVTMPKGHDGKPIGAIVMPHGGPSSRDYWGFDWLSQFFAARGYAVIQPNYRGSQGYGEDFQNGNGFQGWRTAVTDIEDAARYLIAEGIADADRIAIVGWSYGGYAALLGAAEAPDLYKAAVAIAPVTDLGQLVDDARGFSNEALVKEMIGRGDQQTAGSPLRRIGDIKAPVLLVHGDMDTNVRIRHSDKMADALKGAGKEVQYLRYEDLDHQLGSSSARMEMLKAADRLLSKTIGQ
ncbi:alpha/beta hydrolase family protein [Sphingomicrobium flavum]|uniref:alpha/beta hydrolase family protein n=1 Tax=Sphingomicrobium flavum TaxID=1229164 RepID=UPI0021AD57DE|nr:S9 family peptidase [Sphingomicrobium flavum]